MKDNALETTRGGTGDAEGVHTAALRIRAGSASIDGDLAISTRGLLAVGGMVSGILLSVAVLVLASTRKLPDDTLPPGHEGG